MNTFKLVFFFVLFSFAVLAQSPQWAWTAGGNGLDVAQTCKVAPNGNVYVAGEFSGTMDLDPSAVTNNIVAIGPTDMYLACYTSTGALVWGFRIGGNDQERIFDIACDAQGNVFTTGFFRGTTDFDPSASVANLNDNTTQGYAQTWMGEMFIAKYSPAGTYLWAISLGGWTQYDMLNSLGVDGDGNVYAGGVFVDAVDADPSANTANLFSATGKLILAKYSPGGQYIWAKNFGTPGTGAVNLDIRGLQVRGSSIYCTGFFQQTADFDPSAGVASFSSNGLYDAYVAKYDTAGNYVWAIPISGNDYDDALDIRHDANNNVYITGFSYSSSVTYSPFVSSTVNAPVGSGGENMMLAKYSDAGVYQWGHLIGAQSGDRGRDVEIVNNNSLYVTGFFSGTVDFDPSAAVSNLVSNGGQDIFLCEYDLNGNYICGFVVGGTTGLLEEGCKVSSSGSAIYICGSYAGTNVDFDPTSSVLQRTSNGDLDNFLVKYLPATGNTYGVVADTICAGQTAYITVIDSTSAGTFTLTLNDGFNTYNYPNIQSGVPFALNPSPSSTTTYTWSAGGQSLCMSGVSSGSFTVLVNPQPAVNAGPDVTVCNNFFVQLNGSGAASYSWSPASVLNNGGIANPTLTVIDTTITFTLTGTSSAGCPDTDQVNVSVHPQPVANAGNDTAICPGIVQLQASGGTSYDWYPSTGLNNPNISNPVFYGSSDVTVNVIVTDQHGCSDTDDVMITMLPQLTADAGPDQLVCAGDTVSLQAGGGTDYNWYPAQGMTGSNTANPTVYLVETTTYSVIVSGSGGCTDTDAVTISVIAIPEFQISPQQHICEGDSVMLIAGGGNSYTWGPDSDISMIGNDTVIVWPQNTTTYYVAITEAQCGYSDSESVLVEVHRPVVEIIKATPIGCGQNFGLLEATGATQYVWTPAGSLSDSNIANPASLATVPTWYTVVGTDQYGCVGTDSALIQVIDDNMGGLYVPTAFTPNNDGKNDCYRILLPLGITDFELHIYNRFGNRVFTTTDPTDCWDGNYKGRLCDVGTYYYYYKLKSPACGMEMDGKGDITLIR